MFENVSKESIDRDLARIPKRPIPTEATAEREYYKMIEKVKKDKKAERDEYLTK